MEKEQRIKQREEYKRLRSLQFCINCGKKTEINKKTGVGFSHCNSCKDYTKRMRAEMKLKGLCYNCGDKTEYNIKSRKHMVRCRKCSDEFNVKYNKKIITK